MNIHLEVIPHENQRLNAPGDWFFSSDGDLIVRVTDLGDWRFNFLLARHEMDEALLCKHAGISVQSVDEYDTRLASKDDDPDSFTGYPGAPYQAQHNDALAAEWQMARLLGVDWEEYGKALAPFWK
jgi:hypothetical protein